MKSMEHEAVVIHVRHGTYTLWMSLEGREVEIAYHPATTDEAAVLEASLRQNLPVVVTVESGIFIRGIRPK